MDKQEIKLVTDLVYGTVRAQSAIISALQAQLGPDFMRKVIDSLQVAANIRSQSPVTLEDLPSRILLQTLNPPSPKKKADLDAWLQTELGRLLS